MRSRAVGLFVGILLAGAWCSAARGDGGTVRLSRRVGGYEIVVFTSPTPLRAGPVDVSVLVQDAETGEPASNSEVEVAVRVTPRGRPDAAMHAPAITEAATNKLLHAAPLEIPEPGVYDVEVAIAGKSGDARVRFTMRAADPLPRWPTLGPWISLPALAAALFAIHQRLIWRKSRRPPESPPTSASSATRSKRSGM